VAHRLVALAHQTYAAREINDENDTRQELMHVTEITADALNSGRLRTLRPSRVNRRSGEQVDQSY
jgi:hypothetical protein